MWRAPDASPQDPSPSSSSGRCQRGSNLDGSPGHRQGVQAARPAALGAGEHQGPASRLCQMETGHALTGQCLEGTADRPQRGVWVVPAPGGGPRAPFREVSAVAVAAEDPVGGGAAQADGEGQGALPRLCLRTGDAASRPYTSFPRLRWGSGSRPPTEAGPDGEREHGLRAKRHDPAGVACGQWITIITVANLRVQPLPDITAAGGLSCLGRKGGCHSRLWSWSRSCDAGAVLTATSSFS